MVKRGRDKSLKRRSRRELLLDYMRALAHAPNYTLRRNELSSEVKSTSGKSIKLFENFGIENEYIEVKKLGYKNKEFTLLEKGIDLVRDIERVERKHGFYFSSAVSSAIRTLEANKKS